MKIGTGSKLLFIGDSITDAGRAKPVGEGLFEALGKGYVNLVAGQLGAACPERRIRVVNMGTSGHTVRDLKARWKTDVLDLKPDWLAIMIGINDVWRQFDLPLQSEIHVGLEEYERTLGELADAARPGLKGLVLMTPFFIEALKNDAMRARMDAYGAVVRKLAKSRKAILVDTQAAFDAYLRHQHSASLAWDRIHPNTTGHTILARAFLRGVGFGG
ncbi:MAG: SGNH/GDSL hydrolase family protein [Planctomycetota bacterium]|nr:SGNH/GDSL hydrolase family protein [Planctomycetota bacterium]